MILQELASYYDRSTDLPRPGWEMQRIPYVIELKQDGVFVQVTSLKVGKKAADVTPSLVPKAEIRSGKNAFESPNALWDHIGFVVGWPKDDTTKEKEAAQRQLGAFKNRVHQLSNQCPQSAGLAAVQNFYVRGEYKRVPLDSLWQECLKVAGCKMTFRLSSETDLVVQEAAVAALFSGEADGGSTPNGICLVSGKFAPIQQLHFPVAGVNEKPAPFAAVNDDDKPAFASFGKHQGFNFPISQEVAFKYVTALNHLMRPGSRQRMQVGDASTVFWAQKTEDTDMEGWFAEAFSESDDPNARTEQIRTLLEAIRTGRFDGARGTNRFFVLGLAPNAARIAVRFWHAATLYEIAKRTREWFDDLRIDRGPNDPEYPTLSQLLRSTAVLGETKNIQPNLAGSATRSILNGTPLPEPVLVTTLQRCRADQAKKNNTTGKAVQHVSHARAALLKACLNRLIRYHRLQGKEITVSLDTDSTDPAYRLGRLFAAYERIQSDAAGSRALNRSIRDTYFGSAMSNPASVFPRLVQLNQHHMRDLRRSAPGLHVMRDRLLAEIWDGLTTNNAFPTVQPLPDRARFALGYYHQRQDFFKTASEPTSADATTTA